MKMAGVGSSKKEKEATAFFVNALQNLPMECNGRVHHIKLFRTLIDEGDEDLQEHFYGYNESQKYKFFSKRTHFFKINAGYVSLKPLHKMKKESQEQVNISNIAMRNIYSSLPADINLDVELENAHMAANASAQQQLVEFFAGLLCENGESHYLKLIKQLQDSNCDAKDYFNNFVDMEKLYFFRSHADRFAVGLDGFVTLSDKSIGAYSFKTLEEKVVELAVIHLQLAGEMHFEKLLNDVGEASPEIEAFLGHLSKSMKFRFFKKYASYFLIEGNGYVILPPSADICEPPSTTAVVEPSADISDYLVSQLQMYGAVHFEKLAKSLYSAQESIRDSLSDLSTSDLFQFFRNHPNFNVRNDGYVVLKAVSNPCQVNLDKKTLKFMVQVLKVSGKMHLENLLKYTTAFYPEVKSHFAGLTVQGKCNVFRDHSDYFIVTDDGFISSQEGDNKIPANPIGKKETSDVLQKHAGAKNAAAKSRDSQLSNIRLSKSSYSTLYQTLVNQKPLQISDQSKFPIQWPVLKCLSSASASSSKDVLKSSHPSQPVPASEQTSMKPLTSDVQKNASSSLCRNQGNSDLDGQTARCRGGTIEKMPLPCNDVIKLANGLPHSGSLNMTSHDSEESRMKSSNKLDPLLHVKQQSPNPTNVLNTLSTSDAIITDFVALRLTSQPMHCNNIIKLLNLSHANTVKLFQSYTLSDVIHFFRKRERFLVTEEGIVSLKPGVCWKNRINNSADPGSIEKVVLQLAVKTIEESGHLHYVKLINCIQSSVQVTNYFSHFSFSGRYWFFKDRPSHFVIDGSGFVLLAESVNVTESNQILTLGTVAEPEVASWSGPMRSLTGSSGQRQGELEKKVVEFLSNCLENSETKKMHYQKLAKCLEGSPGELEFFFDNETPSEVYQFFKKKRSKFLVHSDGYISLPPSRSEPKPLSAKAQSNVENTKVIATRAFNKEEQQIIDIMVSHLRKQKSSHFERLCQLSLKTCAFFQCYSVSQQFKFLREANHVFVTGNDGYVTLLESLKPIPLQEDIKEDMMSSFVKILTTIKKKKTYKGLRFCAMACCQAPTSERTKRLQEYLQKCTSSDIYKFIKSRPHYFIMEETGHVYLNTESQTDVRSKIASVADKKSVSHASSPDTNQSVSPVDKKSSLPQRKYEECNTTKCVETSAQKEICTTPPKNSRSWYVRGNATWEEGAEHVTQLSKNEDKFAGEGYPHSKNCVNTEPLSPERCSSEKKEAPNKSTHGIDLKIHLADDFVYETDFEKLKTSFSPTKGTNYKAGTNSIINFSPMHIYSIRCCVRFLKARKNIHYRLLRDMFLKSSVMYEFYSMFSLTDVLNFLKIHSVYFHVDDMGIVTLRNPEIHLSLVLVSYDDLLKVYKLMVSEAVKFYSSVFAQQAVLSITKLQRYLNCSPGYVKSYFMANYGGEKFALFFSEHSDCFHVDTGKRVQMKTSACNSVEDVSILADGKIQENQEGLDCNHDECQNDANNVQSKSAYSFLSSSNQNVDGTNKNLDSPVVCEDVNKSNAIVVSSSNNFETESNPDLCNKDDETTSSIRSPTRGFRHFLKTGFNENLADALTKACEELKLAKQTLGEFLDSQCQRSIDMNYSEYNNVSLKAMLQSLSQCFDPVIDKKCVDFFREALLGEVEPMTLPLLLAHVTRAPHDVKLYLISRYAIQDLSVFFYMHLNYFVVHPDKRVSLRRGTKQSDLSA